MKAYLVGGGIAHTWEDNIKIDLKEVSYEDVFRFTCFRLR